MPSVDVVDRQYAPGTYEVKLPVGAIAKGARIAFTRPASIRTAVGDVATVRIYTSDDEVTWTLLRTITIPGGSVRGKNGLVATESWFQFEWPGEWKDGIRSELKRAHVRVLVDVLRACRTAIRLESV